MDIKINSITVANFRGITTEQSLSFLSQGKAESALIIGDNGIGKSSFIDAIELITQGSIHSERGKAMGGWIYSSVSRYSKECARIKIDLSSGENYEKRIELDFENETALVDNYNIEEFCKAPFVLRRRDITDFWNIQSIQRLRIFAPYSQENEREVSISAKERIAVLERDRASLKEERRIILEELCKYYSLDYNVMIHKTRDEVFNIFKLLNQNIPLQRLKKNHPKYLQLKQLSRLYAEIAKYNADIKRITKQDKIIATEISGKYSDLKRKMEIIAPLITQEFKAISKTNDYVSQITISIAGKSDVSLEFNVRLDNGRSIRPEMFFSEANRDLLALLIFFEFIYEQGNHGQAKVLVMDDIFQSVDATVRFRLMQFLIDKFKDWQLIITTHDRLWKEQLTQLFRSHGKVLQQYEIRQWLFSSGPQLIAGINNYDDKLKNAMLHGSVSDICAAAGYVLEYMCNQLSYILKVSVQRKQGDHYTIGDLWPGVFKIMRKTKAQAVFTELNDLVFLRNVVGSHYNEWSLSLSKREALDFAEAVLNSYYCVCSESTGKWITTKDDVTGEPI